MRAPLTSSPRTPLAFATKNAAFSSAATTRHAPLWRRLVRSAMTSSPGPDVLAHRKLRRSDGRRYNQNVSSTTSLLPRPYYKLSPLCIGRSPSNLCPSLAGRFLSRPLSRTLNSTPALAKDSSAHLRPHATTCTCSGWGCASPRIDQRHALPRKISSTGADPSRFICRSAF